MEMLRNLTNLLKFIEPALTLKDFLIVMIPSLIAVACWVHTNYALGKAFTMRIKKRKILIYTKDNFEKISRRLIDSSFFKEKNVVKGDSTDQVPDYDLIIVDWESFGSQIEGIYHRKKSGVPVIIYARGRLEQYDDLVDRYPTTVVNSLSRLANDVILSLFMTA